MLTFSTYDAAGRLLASWRRAWEYWHVTGGPDRIGFRPEAVRLVVTSAEGARAESALDRDELALTLR